MARRADPARFTLGLAAGLLLSCSAATPGPGREPARPLVGVQPRMELRLSTPDDGPARTLRVSVLVEPTDGVPFSVVPVGGDGSGLLELTVRWHDFRAEPTTSGRSTQAVLPWVGAGRAEDGAPLVMTTSVALGDPRDALARRITVDGRLIGVDLVREDGHTGGSLFNLARATLETSPLPPAGTLERQLQEGDPAGIFLSAVASPPAVREDVVGRLVAALPESGGAGREAIFGALLFLTGETHGRDVWRWTTWWKQREAAGAAR